MAIRLERLKIHRFRDVVSGTELHFSHGWNVLLGRNATGKTTLLHLISMALRGDFGALAGEVFDLEYELRHEATSLRVRVKNESPREHVSRKVLGQFAWGDGAFDDVGPEASVVSLRAEYEAGSSTVRFVSPGAPARLQETEQGQVLELLRGRSTLSVAHWLVLALRPRAAPRFPFASSAYRFDEGVELLRNLRGSDSDAPGLPGSIGFVAQVATGDLRALPLELPFADWVPDQEGEATTTWHVTFSRCVNLTRAAMQVDGTAFVATYPVTSNELEQDVRFMQLGPPTILLRRGDGSSVSIDRLSFGQKRLFAFAWYLDANPHAVIADELVNGMHYEWIEDCVHAMDGRQVFVTAQNPLLLDHVPVASPDDVTRSFVLCAAARAEEGRREVRWTNPSSEQATEFFRAYENGLLRVHEILRTEGLW